MADTWTIVLLVGSVISLLSWGILQVVDHFVHPAVVPSWVRRLLWVVGCLGAVLSAVLALLAGRKTSPRGPGAQPPAGESARIIDGTEAAAEDVKRTITEEMTDDEVAARGARLFDPERKGR